MVRDLNTMIIIQREKEKDIKEKGLPPLDPAGVTLAEHCRFSFDIVATPVDPKR